MAVCALAVCLAGCSKNTAPEQAVFGGPAKVTLVVDGGSGSATKISANVDEANTVKSVKIFAFKHAPGGAQNNELVGYGYWDGISGQGPHYCTMQLSASGNIDFYVIANDEYATRAAGYEILDETSTRSDIEGVRFSGLGEIVETSAIPMTNILNGAEGNVDNNNFTFNISEELDAQVIDIAVTRAMARLSFFFAKAEEDLSVIINSIELVCQNPPVTAGYFVTKGSADDFATTDYSLSETILSNATVTKVNETGSLEDSNLQQVGYDSYLLPNIYGSADPDSQTLADDAGKAYTAQIEYTFNGKHCSKTVYLPSVAPNDWIKVKGIFSPVDVDILVIALSWEGREMNIEFN
ncbi:MAG: hypothetical protein IAC06_03350 [Bacteroidetes bacterium]|uniref:Uncharacterized protein n=1 Tax=Candidatus Cryptobacteroides intestinavium TaxID=2840766 RepID=A0A9D9HF52_9BACT|nr:hypothetical protein [Candidatus Cryptobacteroides intestinavium]